LLLGSKTIVVIECKLSDYLGAQVQLHGLYIPVLQRAYPEKTLTVLKYLSQVGPEVPVYETIKQALEGNAEGVTHWLGKGPV
jgi:hypothetical protein